MDESQPSRRSAPERLRRGELGPGGLAILLVVLAVLVLGAASFGGWGAIVAVAVVMVAFIALMFSWIAADGDATTAADQPK